MKCFRTHLELPSERGTIKIRYMTLEILLEITEI